MKLYCWEILLCLVFFTACGNQQASSPEERDGDFYNRGSKLIKNYYSNDSTTNNWTDVVSRDGNFKIKFPFQPVSDTEIQIISNKRIVTVSYRIDVPKARKKNDNLGYSVSYRKDYYAPRGRSFDDFVEDQKDLYAKTTNWELQWEKILKLNKGEGREMLLTLNEGRVQIHLWLLRYSGRLYILTVVTDSDHLFNFAISNFFKSFSFLI